MTEPKGAARPRAVSKAAAPGQRVAAGSTAKSNPTVAATSTPSAKPKHKLVRDSFTIPKAEYSVLEGLKLRAAELKRPTKKSELLRAGIAALHAMSDKAFLAVLSSVPSLKTGRPKKAQGKAAVVS